MQRIVVIGTSGSGKTTMARALAKRLNLPMLELDSIYWQPGWQVAPDAEIRAAVDAYIAKKEWACDGNYSKYRGPILARADTVIWLDYSMRVTFLRVLRRTIRRSWTQESICNGNHERFWPQLASRDSLLLWVINTWRIRRRAFPNLLRELKSQGKRVLRFRDPAAADRWLDTIHLRTVTVS